MTDQQPTATLADLSHAAAELIRAVAAMPQPSQGAACHHLVAMLASMGNTLAKPGGILPNPAVVKGDNPATRQPDSYVT